MLAHSCCMSLFNRIGNEVGVCPQVLNGVCAIMAIQKVCRDLTRSHVNFCNVLTQHAILCIEDAVRGCCDLRPSLYASCSVGLALHRPHIVLSASLWPSSGEVLALHFHRKQLLLLLALPPIDFLSLFWKLTSRPVLCSFHLP